MQASAIKDLAVGATHKVMSQLRDDDSALNRGRESIRAADGKVRQLTRAQPVVAVLVAVLAGYTMGRALAKIS